MRGGVVQHQVHVEVGGHLGVELRRNLPNSTATARVATQYATDRGPTISVVNVDGRLEVPRDGTLVFSSDAKSQLQLDEDHRAFVAAVSELAGRVRADDPEVDVIVKLSLA